MEPQVDISCHQMKLSVPELGYMQLNSWPKGSFWNHQITQAVAKAMGYSVLTDGKAPLLKTTLIQLIVHGELKLVPT